MKRASINRIRSSVRETVQQGFSLGIFFAILVSAANAAVSTSSADERANATVRTASLPLYFEENRGQTDPGVHFVNRGAGSTTFFRQGDVVMRLPAASGSRSAIVQMQFLGGDEDVTLRGSDLLPGKSAYFRGSDPARWIKDAAHFASLTYDDVYPGIDVVFHGYEGELRYDFHIAPHADPRQILLAFTGIEGAELAPNGDLVLDTPADEIVHRAPIVYQEIDGTKVPNFIRASGLRPFTATGHRSRNLVFHVPGRSGWR